MKKAIFIIFFIAALKAKAFEMVQSGCSMYPALPLKSIVNVNGLVRYDELKPGMIAVFQGDVEFKGCICHRLIKHHEKGLIFGEGWVTKGDHNKRIDAGLMTRKNYIGIVEGYRIQ